MPVPPCAIETKDYAPIQFGGCAIGTTMQEFALSPEGALRNCTLHRTKIGGATDVLDEAVDPVALLSAPEVSEYRNETPEFCHGCVHEKSCAGGCGAAAEWVLGHARRFVDPFVAQYTDDGLAERLERERAGSSKKRHLEVVL
jgi:radical SAM protein with 4Fe4S-binding SPASM domain